MIKIKVQSKENKKMTIYLPYWLLSFAFSDFCKKKLLNKIPYKKVEFIDNLGITNTKSFTKALKEYKGLNIVDISSRNGEKIKINL
ncbi:MAG: hypothetical protein KID00_06875 [Clostridium argentinense]|uniref:Uncharacterized protein n=1 Tax=Clostridium faecium TaxID=2762223 RepID=A0ABR8YSB3_9CLOT|nr:MULTISPECIES: hypothetical protein [Clostridium]MBD8047136.1 hypothetical protein [Clostridium faecium]MBS5823572.1 hypothetical protein [Clostridium argentinense]MDU1349590.1 hypothetical protein [Clostridium argentinense]